MIYRDTSGYLHNININNFKNDKLFYDYLMKIKNNNCI